jgi:uncharacterized protein (TIGR02118 family)
MYRISVLYPNPPDAKFDHEYYLRTHCPMVEDLLREYGCLRVEIDRGVAAGDGGRAPFIAVGHIIIDTLEGFQKGMAVHGKQMVGDIPNYTNTTPQILVSQMAA